VVNRGGQRPREAKNAKTRQNGRNLGWIRNFGPFRPCYTLDLFDTGLGDAWQGPIFDRTLRPVTRDCRIDRNGTVTEIREDISNLSRISQLTGNYMLLSSVMMIWVCSFLWPDICGGVCQDAWIQHYAWWAEQGSPKGEHNYLLNLFGRVSMFAETYLIDDLQTEASLQNLKIAGCTYQITCHREAHWGFLYFRAGSGGRFMKT
jgi:hypothetical protein